MCPHRVLFTQTAKLIPRIIGLMLSLFFILTVILLNVTNCRVQWLRSLVHWSVYYYRKGATQPAAGDSKHSVCCKNETAIQLRVWLCSVQPCGPLPVS